MQQKIDAGAAPQLALHASVHHDRVPTTANLQVIKRLDELALNTAQRRLPLRVPLVEESLAQIRRYSLSATSEDVLRLGTD